MMKYSRSTNRNGGRGYAGLCSGIEKALLRISSSVTTHSSVALNHAARKLAAQERQKVLIKLICVCIGQSIRRAGINLQDRVRDEFLTRTRSDIHWNDLVVLAVNDQCRSVELQQIGREIRFGKGFDRFVDVLETACHSLAPPRIDQTLRHIGARSIKAVERPCGDVLE